MRMATGSGSAIGNPRGNPQGQCKSENGAATGALSGRDRALMRFDDGTTNGESQPHAGSRRLTLAAGELLEYCLLSARGQSRTVVGDSHAELIADDLRRQGRRAARGRVLRYIL